MSAETSDTTGTDAQEDSVFAAQAQRRCQDEAYLLFPSLCPDRIEPEIVQLSGEAHTFGRSASSADTRLSDRKISKLHAVIKRTPSGWFLIDLDSRNGSYVNGQPVVTEQRVPLSDGSLIRLGESVAVFRHGAPPTRFVNEGALPGNSPAMALARARLLQVGGLRIPILILGETGTGKEYAARAVHEAGGAPRSSFVAVNCGELTKALSRAELFGAERGAFTDAKEARSGLIAAANDGTLFLDEIGELEADVQVELLRFLEAGTFRPLGATKLQSSNARIVAATHVDMADAVNTGRFRRDLFARLKAAVSPIRLPPLRERPEDIVPWALTFMRASAAQMNASPRPISAGFAEAIVLHSWSENLRALRGAMGSVLLSANKAQRFTASDLPTEVQQERVRARSGAPQVLPGARSPVKRVDREALVEALKAEAGVVKKAAARMGLERTKFYRLCDELGVSPKKFR